MALSENPDLAPLPSLMVVKEDEGWVEDDWSVGGDIRPDSSFDLAKNRWDVGVEASRSGRWNSILSIGRRLFSRGKEEQSSLGRALFNVEKPAQTPLDSILVPLIDRHSGGGNGVEGDVDDFSASGSARDGEARPSSSTTGGPLPDVRLSRNRVEPSVRAARMPTAVLDRHSGRHGPLPDEVDAGDLKPEAFTPLEELELGFGADWDFRETTTRMTWIERMQSLARGPIPFPTTISLEGWRSGSSLQWLSTWWQKVLEVLPVLAVVTLGVVGTFLYLFVADGWWQVHRGPFSLSCPVGEGKWVRSLDRPLYPATCPYLRDEWNCHKYGGASAGFTLGPDSAMGMGIGLGTWRWEPALCTLPHFDAREFLRVMRNRHVAFVGDQSAANAFDSMVCMLAEASDPSLLSPTARSGEGEGEGDGGGVREKSGWAGWGFHWGKGAGGVGGSSGQLAKEERGWGSRDMHYLFHTYNFTLSLYISPFLVERKVNHPVNATKCQLSKQARPSPVPRGNASEQGSPDAESSVLEACYPNEVLVDQPDPLWATDAPHIDVLILNSGRDWREEEVEAQGLGFFSQGVRQPQFSVEGYSGQWAYPVAMRAVGEWLANPSNFKGQAIFRSYTPGHNRRECAGRTMLTRDVLRGLTLEEEAERYNRALAGGIPDPGSPPGTPPRVPPELHPGIPSRLRFSNVSVMAMQRGDGHPWMATPSRPNPDCVNWCLPGVPDVWNEVAAAEILVMFGNGRPLRSVVSLEGGHVQ